MGFTPSLGRSLLRPLGSDLLLPHLGVAALSRQQLLMRPLLYDSSVAEIDDLVCVCDGREAVTVTSC